MQVNSRSRPSSRGPKEITRKGNVIRTKRYDIIIEKDRVRIYDRKTKTWTEAYGDPHLKTSDGDRAQFHEDNLTIDLKDGTKITIVPTEKDSNGNSWIDQVAVMNEKSAILVKDVHEKPEFGEVTSDAAALDAMHEDGTVLRAGREVDDLFFAADCKELVGKDPNAKYGEHVLDGKGGDSNYDFELEKTLDEIKDELQEIREEIDSAGEDVGSSGGDLYSRLFAILARIDSQLEETADELERLQALKEKAGKYDKGIAKLEDKLAALEAAEPKDEKAIAAVKKELEELKQEKAQKIPANIEGRIQKLTFETQRMQNFKSQASTMMTQLLQTDHQAKMNILRNVRN